MLKDICMKKYNKEIKDCTNEEIYFALLDMTKKLADGKVSEEGQKKVYYISAEFLIGKLLSNNLINLGVFDEVKQVLAENGKSIYDIEEVEPEPSLGNGGLGRLAACFLDSMATSDFTEMELDLTTTWVCSSRYLRTTTRRRLQILGLRQTAGSRRQTLPTRSHLAT